MFYRSANSHRQWCNVCGGHLMTSHPEWKLVDVYAATVPSVNFKPGVHVNYQVKYFSGAEGRAAQVARFPEGTWRVR